MNTELLRRPFRRRGDPLRPQGSGGSLVNGPKTAANDALKKCMSLLGVGLELSALQQQEEQHLRAKRTTLFDSSR